MSRLARPQDSGSQHTLTQDETLDFELGCVPATGAARAMGYWKHQASAIHRDKQLKRQGSYTKLRILYNC